MAGLALPPPGNAFFSRSWPRRIMSSRSGGEPCGPLGPRGPCPHGRRRHCRRRRPTGRRRRRSDCSRASNSFPFGLPAGAGWRMHVVAFIGMRQSRFQRGLGRQPARSRRQSAFDGPAPYVARFDRTLPAPFVDDVACRMAILLAGRHVLGATISPYRRVDLRKPRVALKMRQHMRECAAGRQRRLPADRSRHRR